MKKSLFSRGFTLIELIIVIAIIAILTGIIVANLTGARAKSRDAQRVSDLGQLQLALELYFDRCNQYPTGHDAGAVTYLVKDDTGTSPSGNSCISNGATITMGSFTSKIPVPLPGTNPVQTQYDYVVDGSSRDYVLHALLEGANTVLPNDLGADAPGYASSLHCHNPMNYCVGPK